MPEFVDAPKQRRFRVKVCRKGVFHLLAMGLAGKRGVRILDTTAEFLTRIPGGQTGGLRGVKAVLEDGEGFGIECGRSGVGTLLLDIVLLDLGVKGRPCDAEQVGGAGLLPAGFLKRTGD